MKYIIFLGDGMADYPIEELTNKTPLMKALKPNLDLLAQEGCCGLLKTIPEGMPKGSAVANLSVMGYNPKECFEGRGVLEAASQGIEVEAEDLVFRCNLISIEGEKIYNHSADHLPTEDGKTLIDFLNQELGTEEIIFHPGISYRHILILKGKKFSKEITCSPPHDYPGKEFKPLLVQGDTETAKLLNNLILKSQEILKKHPINLERIKKGKAAANSIWPWSPGHKPKMKTYQELFGKTGAVISAVDLIQGIGVYAGLEVIKVPGATGLFDTNYEGKAQAALDALKKYDFVYCHVEAPDEAGHEGDYELKIKTIQDFDQRLVQNVIQGMDQISDDVTIAILPDHFTPCSLKTHTDEPIPFLIYRPAGEMDDVIFYNEETCKKGKYGTIENTEFIKLFFGV